MDRAFWQWLVLIVVLLVGSFAGALAYRAIARKLFARAEAMASDRRRGAVMMRAVQRRRRLGAALAFVALARRRRVPGPIRGARRL